MIVPSKFFKISTFVFFTFTISACFAPGSYPYVEEYEVNTKEGNLIKAIENFKRDNPEFNPPEQAGLKDGRINDKALWYDIYFYYPQENQLIHTWTRPALNPQKTTFALVGVNDGLKLGNWKRINHDLSSSEDDSQKEKFTTRILNKVKAYLK
jgi:hypothetical protein